MPIVERYVDGMIIKSYVSEKSLKGAGGRNNIYSMSGSFSKKVNTKRLGRNLGEMAGGTAGMVAGATLGSVVPGIGNFMGAGIGMGVGMLAGRMAGQHMGTKAPKVAKNPKTLGQKFNALDQKVHAWSASKRAPAAPKPKMPKLR